MVGKGQVENRIEPQWRRSRGFVSPKSRLKGEYHDQCYSETARRPGHRRVGKGCEFEIAAFGGFGDPGCRGMMTMMTVA
jgi:hypothetical protein